jgi:hypothetical protein
VSGAVYFRNDCTWAFMRKNWKLNTKSPGQTDNADCSNLGVRSRMQRRRQDEEATLFDGLEEEAPVSKGPDVRVFES